MSTERALETTISHPMALFSPHPLHPPTHESAPKSTTANNEQELWDLIEQTETAAPISPVQDESVHPDIQNAKPSFVLPDFDDMEFNDIKDFWKCFETMPPENVSDEAFMAHFPAKLVPPSLQAAPPHESEPHLPTPVPPPSTSPISALPPGSPQPGQNCPKLNFVFGSIKKKLPIKETKMKRKGQRGRKKPDSASKSIQDQHFLGWMSGQQLFKVPEDGDSDDGNHVYIKKPPNAFMLFMEEQRPNVSKELWRKGSGAVNSHLAEIWRSMSKEEQSAYFSESERLTILHKVKYPYWSHQMNYGKKRQKDKSGVSSPESNFAMPDPRNPAQVLQGPHAQSNMTQPSVQHGAYIPDPPPQGPFLPYDLPQGPYMWNPNPQSPFFQNHLPQGPGMLNPHQPGPYVQNPQPQGPYMCNPNAQGPFMLNPYSQGPYMHTSHTQGPFMMNYYAQGPYMHNPHSQAATMNYPYPEGPYMNNPVPQRPLQSHYPEGIYMCSQQSLGDCMPTQQSTDGVHAKSRPQAYLPSLGCEPEGDYLVSTRNVPGPS